MLENYPYFKYGFFFGIDFDLMQYLCQVKNHASVFPGWVFPLPDFSFPERHSDLQKNKKQKFDPKTKT